MLLLKIRSVRQSVSQSVGQSISSLKYFMRVRWKPDTCGMSSSLNNPMHAVCFGPLEGRDFDVLHFVTFSQLTSYHILFYFTESYLVLHNRLY